MRSSFWLGPCCLACLLCAGCQDAVVARVNGVPIYRRAFLHRVAMESNHHASSRATDQAGLKQRIERMVLRRMVDAEKFRQQGERLGIVVNADILADQLRLRRERLGGEHAYHQWLAATHTTQEELALQEREDYLAEQVAERLMGPVVVPQEDLERYALHEREEQRERDHDADEDDDDEAADAPQRLRAELLHGGLEGARSILTLRHRASLRRATQQKIRAGGAVEVNAPYVLE